MHLFGVVRRRRLISLELCQATSGRGLVLGGGNHAFVFAVDRRILELFIDHRIVDSRAEIKVER